MNDFFDLFKSKISVKIVGNNIERFIKRLSTNNVELLNIKYPKWNVVIIEIYEYDFKKIEELKTIYNISIVGTSGLIYIKKMMKKNKYMFFSIIIGLIGLVILSNYMYKVEIIHSNSKLRKMLKRELYEYGIKENSFKKNYNEIQKIKKQILVTHKDTIEWLEINVVGTKYQIRVEERKLLNIENKFVKQNVIAKKSAIIKRVIAKSGEVLKNINDYVSKDDVIIGGTINLNEETKNIIMAKGVVYGEVWYKVNVDYPYIYHEKNNTGNNRNVIVLNIFNHHFELFTFKHYKYKNTVSKNIIKNNFLPFSLTFDYQEELDIKEEFNTEEKAKEKALEEAVKKMKSKLNDKEYIISQKTLKVNPKKSTMNIEVFFSVYENITDYQTIEEIKKE